MSAADWLALLAAALGGAALGTVHCVGQRWAIRQGAYSRCPGLWFYASLLLRTGVALAGFHWIGDGQWPRLTMCLAGFLLARALILRPSTGRQTAEAPGP